MTKRFEPVSSKPIVFQAEGRLLQELGLRLVASPEVALVELIKNAYDADASSCTIRLENHDKTLVIADTGHGITEADFETKWMTIATSSKTHSDRSPQYKRLMTGSKGIGRFAVRYLGDHLQLDTVADDDGYGVRTHLSAKFEWAKIDSMASIGTARITYDLREAKPDERLGTTLTITQLRQPIDFIKHHTLRDNVLSLITPLQGLDRGRCGSGQLANENDPGFQVLLPGSSAQEESLAEKVLKNRWAQLKIELTGSTLRYQVSFDDSDLPKELELEVDSHIGAGLCADIRFFPKRKGVFKEKGFNGTKAWRWVRDNFGIKVVDHGFLIHPYGFPNDDWLNLDADKAHNLRDWSTGIAKRHFPIEPVVKNDPAESPALNLPYNYQLVGAVFILSAKKDHHRTEDLIPAMDREGLLDNQGFKELREYVRAGIEFLAHEDKAELRRIKARDAKDAIRTARKEIQDAISHIQQIPSLTAADKARIVTQYKQLSERVEKVEELNAAARRNLMIMSLLGVVAGFMTHESKAVVHELQEALHTLESLAEKHKKLKPVAVDLDKRLTSFQDYLEYSRLYVRGLRATEMQPLSAAGQIRFVLQRFRAFAKEHNIEVETDVDEAVMTPPLPVTAYSGVILNLYTNALKAILALQSSAKNARILVRAFNEDTKHVVEVADTGVGIPPALRRKIWEPLYTTTSDIGNPLGSGMGLGLTLVRQVVSDLGGRVLSVEC